MSGDCIWRGIRDGDARRAVQAYTGARYIQHSTGVADGVEGFLSFFEPFMQRNPKREIEIVRAIEDGSCSCTPTNASTAASRNG